MLHQGDFDVVYISTPHSLHYRNAVVALQCGQNVLLEKPATMNAAQYRKLIQLAQSNDAVLMEAMWTHYLPATMYLQQHLFSQIGNVRRVFADFFFPIVSEDLELDSRFLDKSAGAGALLDQGVYALTWMDLALHCHGDKKSAEDTDIVKVICAHSMPVPGKERNDIGDINAIILSKRVASPSKEKAAIAEAVGIVTTSMTLPGSSKPSFYKCLQANKHAPSVRIEATKAQISIPFPPIRPQELRVQWYAGDRLGTDGVEIEEVIEKPIQRGWGLWYQADVIARKVLERRRRCYSREKIGEIIGADESLRVLRYMDEARLLAGIRYDEDLEGL